MQFHYEFEPYNLKLKDTLINIQIQINDLLKQLFLSISYFNSIVFFLVTV
jgi:hypothetical protein